MPVIEQTPVKSSTANGVTTVFPYDFKILDQADLLVTVDGVTKTITTDYTVSGVGSDSGGNVTFVSAPASGALVVRSRNMAYKRDTDYQENGDFLAATVDNDLDRIVMQVQQVAEAVDRAVKVGIGSGANPDALIASIQAAEASATASALAADASADAAAISEANAAASAASLSTITNDKLATMPANTVKANATAGAATPTDIALAVSQLFGRGASGNLAAIALGTNLSMSGTTLNAAASGLTQGTEQATTSGTYKDFSVPAGTKSFIVSFNGVSLSGTSSLAIQLGSSGTPETTNYNASATFVSASVSSSVITSTSRFPVSYNPGVAAEAHSGLVTFNYVGSNVWTSSGVLSRDSTAGSSMSAGRKTMTGTLDTIRITSVNGTDTFDLGSVNVTFFQ